MAQAVEHQGDRSSNCRGSAVGQLYCLREALSCKVKGVARSRDSDRVVEDNSLSQNISALRRVLDPSQQGHQYIETVARRGYRFVVDGISTEPAVNSLGAPVTNAARDLLPVLTGDRPAEEVASDDAAYHFHISRRRLWFAILCCSVAILGIVGYLALHKRRLTPYGPGAITEVDLGEVRVRQYDFEDGPQGWVTNPKLTMITHVASSNEHSYTGRRSLAIYFDGPFARSAQVYVAYPQIPPDTLVKAHVWCPEKSGLSAIAFFIEEKNHSWYDDWRAKSSLDAGTWNNLYLHVPSDAAVPIERLGLEFTSDSAWQGTCYLDSVEW